MPRDRLREACRFGGNGVPKVSDSPDIGSEAIAIVIADDHAMVRGGLRRLLDAEADLLVVAEAGDVETALRP